MGSRYATWETLAGVERTSEAVAALIAVCKTMTDKSVFGRMFLGHEKFDFNRN